VHHDAVGAYHEGDCRGNHPEEGGGVRRDEEEHYDTISAFISRCEAAIPMRRCTGCEMVVAGEDPRFIARRITILRQKTSAWPIPALVCGRRASRGWNSSVGPKARFTVAKHGVLRDRAKSNASAKGSGAESRRGAGAHAYRPSISRTPLQGSERSAAREGIQYAHDFRTCRRTRTSARASQYYEPSDQGLNSKCASDGEMKATSQKTVRDDAGGDKERTARQMRARLAAQSAAACAVKSADIWSDCRCW